MSLLFMTEKCWAFAVVRLEPATVIVGPDYCVGEIFTLTARIDDVEDLYGAELKIEWNTTYLEYVDHVAKVPVEVYSDGVLHEPILIVYDTVNSTIGYYLLAVTSIASALSFTGSGIAFEITFRVKCQPAYPESDVSFSVNFATHEIPDTCACGSIPHVVENSTITISSFHPADFNRDLVIDIFDVVLIAREFGKFENAPDWDPIFDLAEPYGAINIFDVVVVAGSYGQEYIPIT